MSMLRCQIDSLVRQREQTDIGLRSLQNCLDIIEADTELSESSAEAVKQARQYMIEAQCTAGASDAALSWMWVQRRSDTQLTDSQVCALYQPNLLLLFLLLCSI